MPMVRLPRALITVTSRLVYSRTTSNVSVVTFLNRNVTATTNGPLTRIMAVAESVVVKMTAARCSTHSGPVTTTVHRATASTLGPTLPIVNDVKLNGASPQLQHVCEEAQQILSQAFSSSAMGVQQVIGCFLLICLRTCLPLVIYLYVKSLALALLPQKAPLQPPQPRPPQPPLQQQLR